MKKVILVCDILIFESLNNDDLMKYLNNDYFLVLWTSNFYNSIEIDKIPYDGYINGLRNNCKPFRYLRMYLRRYNPEVLGLPVVIVDFEKNFNNSRNGYDLCIDINSIVVQQIYNNLDIDVIDTRKMFNQINGFVQEYRNHSLNIINEEMVLSNSVVLTLNDVFEKSEKQKIINKQCVLVVGSSFFSIYHNIHCKKFQEFLKKCHLVVWTNNKNVDKNQVRDFITTLKNNNINVNFMLFGLDRNVKSISFVRKHLTPTRLPFILIDDIENIYNIQQYEMTTFCDFDYYINMNEYFVAESSFYDMENIILNIEKFIKSTLYKPSSQEKIKIQECHKDKYIVEECNSDDDDKEQVVIPRKRYKK